MVRKSFSRYLKHLGIAAIALCSCFVFAASENPAVPSPDQIVEEIYENPSFLPLIDIQQAKITLQDLATSLQQMQTDYAQVDEKRAYMESRFHEMTSSIEQTIDATETNKARINDTLIKISLLEQGIVALKTELKTLKDDLDTSREYVSTYVLFLYQSYQQLYGATDSLLWMKQLADTRQVDVDLQAQHFANLLTTSLERQLTTIKVKQQDYLEKARDMNAKKLSYYQLARQLKKDMERLQEQKKYLYAQLRALQTDKATLDRHAAELRYSQEELGGELHKLKQLTLEDQVSASDSVAALLNLPDRPVGKNYFTRPVLPPTHPTTFFGELELDIPDLEDKQLSTYLRLEIPQGTLVHATAPGLVYKILASDDGSEQRVILLHKKGLVSIYKPMEDIFVHVGEVIRRGQVIGTSSGQPGTKGAGFLSLQPHLDITVYLNGAVVDPLQYLDLSVLAADKVPDQWKQKYVDDRYAREVPLENIELLPGDSVEARRDAFLSRYAWGPYADAGLRYDAAQGQGIDPLMGICVGYAETSFRHFKSSNNIGNVGNNDRGDTAEYESPMLGARALYAVLNNQYLGGYNTLNELSRFGNNDGFIYASSPYNRQKNVMRCLSSIYGYPIPEDFPFRTLD